MLTGLRLGNFKAFGETQNIPIKPLTLIFGANSAGKSSIIHGLLLARHANETGNLDVHQTRLGGESVNLGGFRQYVHRHETQREVTWAATLDMSRIDDALAVALFNYAKRYSRYPEVESQGYKNFVARLKMLERLEFELCINAHQIVNFTNVPFSPHVVCYSVFAGGGLLLRLERSAEGDLTPTYVNYMHPFFEELWNLIANIEEKISSGAASSLIDYKTNYNSFFKKPNPDHAAASEQFRTTLDNLRKMSLNLDKQEIYRIAMEAEQKLRSVPTYLDVDKEYWDNIIGQYIWERNYTGNFIPRFMSDWQPPNSLRTRSLQQELLAREKTRAKRLRAKRIRKLNGVHSNGGEDEGSQTDNVRLAQMELWKLQEQAQFQFLVGYLVNSLEMLVTSQFDRIKYLGPVRFSPPRNLSSLDSQHPSWYAGGSEWDYVRRDSDVRAAVNHWLGSAKLKTPYKLQLRRFVATDRASDVIEELVLHDQRFDTYVSHKDVGFGISQVLPVLVSAYGSKNSIVAIEQPEIHLHPALQAELGDVFIESALGERKNTFLLETHSEHLILRIMRRMRDTVRGTLPEGMPPVRPEDVAILYVDRKDDDSTSVVSVLELDEEGQLLDPWPGGFFEEGFNERFA